MAVPADVVTSLAAFFTEHVRGLTRTKKGEVIWLGPDGERKYAKYLGGFSFLSKLLEKAPRVQMRKDFADYLEDFEEPAFSPTLIIAIAACLAGTDRDFEKRKHDARTIGKAASQEYAAEVAEQAFFNESITTPLSRMQLIYNLRDRRKSFLYDPDKKILHQYDYDLIMGRLKAVLGDGLEAWLMTNSEDCSPEYRPLTYPRISLDERADVKIFNTWTDAEWRDGWTPDPSATLPAEIGAFLHHFIPGEADRQTMLAWLRDACFERAEPILVLCGKPGTGKNVFVEHIAANLIGKHNYRSASRGFNRTQFHNNVSNCRLFFLDETNLTPETREALKSYHNGLATIERKGIDVGDPEKIHASFAVANNHESKIKLEYTDRKFYVPILSDTPLHQPLGHEITKLMQVPDFVRNLASYLFKTFKPQAANNFEKNLFFKRLCINSYPYYFRRFIHTISATPELTSRQFNKGSKAVVDVFDLEDNIRHYESQFGERIADFQIHDDGQWTALSLVKQPPPGSNGSGNGSGHGYDDDDGKEILTTRSAHASAEAASLMYGSAAAASAAEQQLL